MRAKHTRRTPTSCPLTLPAYFDEERVFDDEIRPLMEQIEAVAIAHGMPFLLAVGYGHSRETGFATASTVCAVEGRAGAELFVASKLLSNPAFAGLVLELLAQDGEAVTQSLHGTTPPPLLM